MYLDAEYRLMGDTLNSVGSNHEILISELIDHITDIEDISFENIDVLKFKLYSDEINYTEISSLIEKKKFKTAILHCFLEINRIKEDHIRDFVKLQEIVKLGNLIGQSLYEWYKHIDGFQTTVAKYDADKTPFTQLIVSARTITEFVLELDTQEITNQFLLARLLFEYYKFEKVSIDEVENAYLRVIDTSKRDYEITNEDDNQLLYSSHLQLGNVFSYASLQNKNLYEKVFTHYNEAYRYGLRNDINTDEIFKTVQKLTRLINGEFPLYALVYSTSGHSIYQYMFEEVRFAPIRDSVGFNLSSLFAARESALQEIFNIKTKQSILEAEDYVIVQNTITKSETENDEIYLMLVFANINKIRSLRDLANFYEPVLQQINDNLLDDSVIRQYFTRFDGFYDDDISHKIDMIIKEIPEWIDNYTLEKEN